MRKVNLITSTADQLKDEYLGEIGTPKRDQYEFELSMEILSEQLKQLRKERGLTQEQLGEMVGVQKATISKLEKSANNVTLDTLKKVFTALNAKVKLHIELEEV